MILVAYLKQLWDGPPREPAPETPGDTVIRELHEHAQAEEVRRRDAARAYNVKRHAMLRTKPDAVTPDQALAALERWSGSGNVPGCPACYLMLGHGGPHLRGTGHRWARCEPGNTESSELFLRVMREVLVRGGGEVPKQVYCQNCAAMALVGYRCSRCTAIGRDGD